MIRRVAIVGSRPPEHRGSHLWEDFGWLVEAAERAVVAMPSTTVIVSGDAAGVDTAAIRKAERHGYLVCRCPVPRQAWVTRGRGVAMVRNLLMVEISHAVIALWNGISPGTKATAEMAQKAGKLAGVVRPGELDKLQNAIEWAKGCTVG